VLAVVEPEPAVVAPGQQSALPRSEGAVVIAEHIRGLALVRSLGRRGIPVWTLEPPGESMASASRYSRKNFVWPADEGAQLECLLSLAARYDLRGWTLFAAGDETTAFCARHHDQLSKYFKVTVPSWDLLRWAYDKRLTHRLATEIGIDQPRTFFPGNRDELSALEISFPVVLKPAFKPEMNAFTRDKAWRVDDREALLARYDEACALVDPDIVMVQELIPGGGETQYSFGALCADGRILASVTARRTRQYPVDFGHSSSFVETIDEPAIATAACRLLAFMRHTGLAEVEFKYDARDGRYKLLEVNPRVWTWHALCRRAGVDLPYLLWRLMRGEPVTECHGRPGAKWVRMTTDLAAAGGELLRGRLTFGAYARSLAGPLELAVFAADDPSPSLLRLPRTLASGVRKSVEALGQRDVGRFDRPVASQTGAPS
jgi:predicted ATP-grasp superfamily ATP-dependent carboligase